MATVTIEKNVVPLHEAVDLLMENCWLQIQGVDVAIPDLRGAPGGGKTSLVKAKCLEDTKRKVGILSTHFALKPIEETGGIPQFEKMEINGKPVLGTIWSFPDIMKKLYELAGLYDMIIWFLDDSHLMGPTHMAMLYELFSERSLRSYEIPKNCAMVMAGNTSNKAGAKTMFSAIVNRCFQIKVIADFQYWKGWAIANNVHPAVISFLSNETYKMYFHQEEQVDVPWCSPRSWTRFSNMLSAKEYWSQKVVASNICAILADGHVGSNASGDFTSYYSIFSKFNIPEILSKADHFILPKEMVDQYALCYALITHYIGLEEKDQVLARQSFAKIAIVYGKNAPELCIMMLKDVIQIEKILGKKSISNNIIMEMNKLESQLTSKIIAQMQDSKNGI